MFQTFPAVYETQEGEYEAEYACANEWAYNKTVELEFEDGVVWNVGD